jgi:UDP-N-acetylmuramyl-tripeptide synthetase
VSAAVIAQVRAALSAHAIEPRTLRADSRHIAPGDIFFALPGERTDGRRFIDAAIDRGAAAVLCEAGTTPITTTNPQVPVIGIDDLHRHAGAIADALLDQPSAHLHVIGITGTNGKTSVSQWIAQALHALGRECGVIGTLGNGLPGRLTLADLRRAGATACAMEVSSIGLHQHRIDGVRLHTAVFTNLTRDHLDYHHDMQHYADAKAALFARPGLQATVINTDDAFGRTLAQQCAGQFDVTTCAFDHAPPAGTTGLRARNAELSHGVSFDLVHGLDQHSAHISTALIGRFNVQNLMAVAGSLLHAGVSLNDAAHALAGLTPPPGRMQGIGGQGKPLVVVDYAHTPDALEQALIALQPVAAARGGRLVCIFGCGGERDAGKRPLMGTVACEQAHQVWLTSDNPRGEDPDAILNDIARGTVEGRRVHRITDRAQAIRQAVAEAVAADVVLLAGKGHESYQERNGRRTPWSDIEQAHAALAAWGVSA